MAHLSPEVEAEVAALARRYGAPLRVAVRLDGKPFDPLEKRDRYGEVCMVIRRPGGGLITARKTFYPEQGFRLLTGGVGHGEPIEDALLREVAEETSLDVAVRRFLAVVEYTLEGSPATFASFAFLLDELGGTLAPQDASERIAAYGEVHPADLPAMADTLAALPDAYSDEIDGSWRDWGRFRAAVHRAVHAALVAE